MSNTIKYLDPYKTRKYALLKGDKAGVFLRAEFKEGKFYKTDNGYVLMADTLGFMGVVKMFKPEDGLPNPGITAIPIYSKEYELWDSKEKKNVTTTATVYEKNLCAHLDLTISLDKYYRGSIVLLPDEEFTNLSDADTVDLVTSNCQLVEIEPSGNLITYEVSDFNSNSKKSYTPKLTPADKVSWLKAELVSSLKDKNNNKDMSLFDLTDELVKQVTNENSLAVYVDFIKATLAD